MEKQLVNWNNRFAAVRRQITQKYLWHAFKLLLALTLTWTVFSQTSFSEVSSLWKRLDYVWLVPSFLFFNIAIIVFALRSWQLINRAVPIQVILLLTTIQTVVGNLVANAVGAVSLIMAMRIKYGVSLRHGLVAVIISKIADMIVLWCLLVVSSMYIWHVNTTVRIMTLFIIVTLLIMIVLLTVLTIYRTYIFSLLSRFLLLPRWKNNYYVKIIYDFMSDFANENLVIVAQDFKYVIILSILNIFSSVVVSYANFRMFGLVIDIPILLFYTAMTQLISWLPVSVFGGLGVFEFSSLYLLSQMGYSEVLLSPIFVSWRIYFYILNIILLPIVFLESSNQKIIRV